MREFVFGASTVLANPAVQYLTEQREHALCNSHCSGLMGAAHGSVQKRRNTRYVIPTVAGLWVTRMDPHKTLR